MCTNQIDGNIFFVVLCYGVRRQKKKNSCGLTLFLFYLFLWFFSLQTEAFTICSRMIRHTFKVYPSIRMQFVCNKWTNEKEKIRKKYRGTVTLCHVMFKLCEFVMLFSLHTMCDRVLLKKKIMKSTARVEKKYSSGILHYFRFYSIVSVSVAMPIIAIETNQWSIEKNPLKENNFFFLAIFNSWKLNFSSNTTQN